MSSCKTRNGKVFIVGSGPGDMGLVTMKALEAIETSDVILYDELANSSLLENCKPGAELIYVGKKASQHTFKQEEIEKMLVERALRGRTVCRLKGGDPFLFGRGGEEVEALAAKGICYEIIPGVTSAIAAPAYAGIPVTHRGVTSGVAIFTGHEDPEKMKSDLNWTAIAKLNATLVFLMGVKNLPAIVENLTQNGMDVNMPVAIVHRGTTPFQRTFVGSLKNIIAMAEKEKIKAPSVIIVGSVVCLREKFAWFEQKPLFGRKILVTRMKKQASKLSRLLRESGAFVQELPTIVIEPNKDAIPDMDRAIKKLSSYNWVVFTSANAVDIFFDRVSFLGLDSRIFGGVKICAIGPSTRDSLAAFSLKADVMPKEYIAESVYEALKGKVSGQKMLLPRSDIARKELCEMLVKDGANVEEIPIYRTKKPEYSADEIEALIEDVEMVTFTSASTVRNFVDIMGSEFKSFKNNFIAASIGPITSRALNDAGIKIACEAKEFTIPGLVESIVGFYLPSPLLTKEGKLS